MKTILKSLGVQLLGTLFQALREALVKLSSEVTKVAPLKNSSTYDVLTQNHGLSNVIKNERAGPSGLPRPSSEGISLRND